MRAALDEGRPVGEVLNDALIAGMAVVGEDFKRAILYVPEVLIAARAMKTSMAVLKPLLIAGAQENAPNPTATSPSCSNASTAPCRHNLRLKSAAPSPRPCSGDFCLARGRYQRLALLFCLSSGSRAISTHG